MIIMAFYALIHGLRSARILASLLTFMLLNSGVIELACFSLSTTFGQAYGIDVRRPVLIVYKDRLSMPANLMVLSIKYRAVLPEELNEVDPFDFSAIIFDYGVGHDDVKEWIISNNWRLLEWLESGGAFLDFTSGEKIVFFDIEISSPEDFEVCFVSDHQLLNSPNILYDATPVAQVVFTGGSDLRNFDVIMEAGGRPVVLVREIRKGRVIICGLYGVGPWFRKGFVKNALYWATKGQLWRSTAYAMRADTEHFAVLYPPFANQSIPSIVPFLDDVYSLMIKFARRLPYEGNRIVLDFTKDIYWRLGMPVSGLAGNPTFIDVWTLPEVGGDPEELICILFHELGHVFLGSYDFLYGDFSEMLAEIAKLYLLEKLGFNEIYKREVNKALRALERYEISGSNFSEINVEVLTGMMVKLKEKYGWELFTRYFKLVDRYTVFPRISNDRRINAFVYLLSVAAGEDLSREFRKWGFPIKKVQLSCNLDKYWEQTGKPVRIFGVLEPPVVGIIFIDYRTKGSDRWKILGVTSTDDYGCYRYEWIPIIEGKYELRARWVEDVDIEMIRSEVIELVIAESFSPEELGLEKVLLVLLNPISASILLLFILFICRKLKS